ncbi:insulinase family protein [Undibacterium piscinae]|uniref:Insulinase family protein n=1 Tax=Undibacterium piscinae TaxID=2495591 RepID=A0A6M4A8S5_9BURK|nr:insulinase family protein [Undibacterium piscinae]
MPQPGQRLLLSGLVSGAFMLLAQTALAQALPKGVSQVTSVEGITEYRLQNGLKVLLMPDASKPTVTVNVTYLVGSRHENYGETGMAHLLEHLMFKGTPKNAKITEEFNRRGMRMNGTTSLDRTNYYELFQAGDDNLQWALSMEADRMVNSNIAQKDLDTEMTVVRNEYESGENSPGGVLIKRLQSVAYDWHNYGHSTIGNRSDIENVKISNLQNFYRTYYQPDNAVLLVAGKFDQDKTLSWIAQSFGAIAKPTRSLPVLWTVEPTQDGERSFEVRRKGDLQLLMIAYKVPAALHPDREAMDFAGSILAGAPHGRLHKQLVETGKLVQVFSTGAGSVDSGLKILGAVVKKGDSVEAAKELLLAGIEDFKKNPPSKEEMDRVKRDSANTYEKILNNHETIGVGLSEYIAMGDWRYLFKDRDGTDLVSAEQVSAAARRYLTRDNRTIGKFIPEDAPQRAEIPAAPAIAEVMRGFTPKANTLSAEAFDPSPANIDQRTERSTIGGLQLALLPKKTRGETVNVALRLHWGDQTSLFGKKHLASFADSLLLTGTSKYTRAQLADEFSKLKISGGLYGFQTTRANLPEALALVAHILREANFPESEFTQMRERTLVSIEASRNEPASVAGMAMAQHFDRYPKGDIRAVESIDESLVSIRALKLADIKAFHQQFYGASKAELSIVGDMDLAATKQAVAAAFGNWASKTAYTRLVYRYDEIPPLRKSLNTPDKENGYYSSLMNIAINEQHADFAAMQVANYIFGGGSGLNSRLMERIRQKDGLSYGGGSSFNAGAIDAVGSFGLSAIAAPQNLAKLEIAIKDELAKALKDGFTAEELARAKSGLLQQRLQARTSDASLAGGWNSNLYLQRSWAWNQSIDDKIAALTLTQVNAAFRTHIDPAKMSVFIAADEAKMQVNQK